MDKRVWSPLHVIWPPLAVGWVALAQVVSFQGLAIWVITGSIICSWLVFTLASGGRRVASIVVMVAGAFIVAGLAEWVGGTSAGPITRASLMACGVAGAMALVAASRYPAAAVPLSLVLLGGALGLGAADEALWIAGVWVVAAGVSLAMTGPYAAKELRGRAWALASLLAIPGLVAVAGMVVASLVLNDPWTQGGPVDAGGSISRESEAAPAAQVPPVAMDSNSDPITSALESARSFPWWMWVLAILVILLALGLGALIASLTWRAWVALSWRWERRRLSRGDDISTVVGAWTWVRLRRARYGDPLPVHLSPDVAVNWARARGEVSVARVAEAAASVAFRSAPSIGSEVGDSVWADAREAGRPPHATMRERWAWSSVTPRVSRERCGSATP